MLTRRERQTLALVVQGRSNREIGRALFLSELTVKTYMGGIRRKLGVRNRAAAAALFTRQVTCRRSGR